MPSARWSWRPRTRFSGRGCPSSSCHAAISDAALEAAQKAETLSPALARTQTVLGYAYLTRIDVDKAKTAFERAIQGDPADPLPRLGMGLAKIRDGDLDEGTREIETAASLDPNNSLVRSYLGKAYYEQKRDGLASGEYEQAKLLDPEDPTPWFYDAIEKQTTNRPVEALHDLQRAIELNDNRAVYRSKLLLDEDLAASSATSQGSTMTLDFTASAGRGVESVTADPANYRHIAFLPIHTARYNATRSLVSANSFNRSCCSRSISRRCNRSSRSRIWRSCKAPAHLACRFMNIIRYSPAMVPGCKPMSSSGTTTP